MSDQPKGEPITLPPLPTDHELYEAACDFDECASYSDILNFAKRIIRERDALWLADRERLAVAAEPVQTEWDAGGWGMKSTGYLYHDPGYPRWDWSEEEPSLVKGRIIRRVVFTNGVAVAPAPVAVAAEPEVFCTIHVDAKSVKAYSQEHADSIHEMIDYCKTIAITAAPSKLPTVSAATPHPRR